MSGSEFEDYFDLEIPDRLRKLIGKCGIFEGIKGPKKMPVRDYGLPEHQALVVALWSFTKLPFYTQLCLIDDFFREKKP